MAGISNTIEKFIIKLLQETENNIIEIQRNELAEQFKCSPSQINYVLSTRFTPYKGYLIESRRGGGGYIRIVKVRFKDQSQISHKVIEIISDGVTKNKAYDILDNLNHNNILSKRETTIVKTILEDRVLTGSVEEKNILRANILKNILLILSDLE